MNKYDNSTQRKVYMNKAQMRCYNIAARDTRVKAGRRTGKTDGILAPYINRASQSMPQGGGIWLGNSRKQLLTRSVPAAISALSRFTGMQEGRHFWWGQPPKKFNIPAPIIKPKDWSQCITFYNGFVWHLVSLEVRGSANGLTSNAIVADESRFLRKEKLDAEVMPTLSGITHPTGHPGFTESNPFYKSTMFVSDAALSLREAWLEKEEEKATPKIMAEILQMVDDANKCPELLRLPKFVRRLNDLRCKCFAFFSFSTLENIDILGEDYIARMKRDLPPVVFAISILNMPKRKSSDGFYSNFDPDIHCYTPVMPEEAISNTIKKKVGSTIIGGQQVKAEYETIDFSELQNIKNCSKDGDIIAGRELHIAFDYNANINWVCTIQDQVYEGIESLMVLSSMYVKNERKLRQLCQDWCKYYEPHRRSCNMVTYYYDSTAKHKSYAVEDVQSFWEVVVEELSGKGWFVNPIDMGRPMEHQVKHAHINEAFQGISSPYPRINKENNEALIVAMENTGVRIGSRGFEKDKSKEKYVETEYDPLELRTDGTDAFDSVFIGVKFFRYGLVGVGMPGIG